MPHLCSYLGLKFCLSGPPLPRRHCLADQRSRTNPSQKLSSSSLFGNSNTTSSSCRYKVHTNYHQRNSAIPIHRDCILQVLRCTVLEQIETRTTQLGGGYYVLIPVVAISEKLLIFDVDITNIFVLEILVIFVFLQPQKYPLFKCSTHVESHFIPAKF